MLYDSGLAAVHVMCVVMAACKLNPEAVRTLHGIVM